MSKASESRARPVIRGQVGGCGRWGWVEARLAGSQIVLNHDLPFDDRPSRLLACVGPFLGSLADVQSL